MPLQASCRSLYSVSALLIVYLISQLGCSAVYVHVNNEDKLDERLSVPMSKEKVLDAVGKPDKVLRDDGRVILWEYHLYPRHAWFANVLFCPFTLGILGCLVPVTNEWSKQQVVLIDDQLCMWGSPQVIETRNTCKQPVLSLTSSSSVDEVAGKASAPKAEIIVTPILMPPHIVRPVKKLAVLPIADVASGKLAVQLDTALTFLRTRHPDLVLVERDVGPILDEILLQHSGRVDDESAVRVGRWAGADTILTYQVLPTTSQRTTSRTHIDGTFELRLIQVESSTLLFRQTATATLIRPKTQAVADEGQEREREEAIQFAKRALRDRGLDESYLPEMVEQVKLQIAMDPSWFERTPIERQYRLLAREVEVRAQAGRAKRGPLPSWPEPSIERAYQVAVRRAAGHALAALVAAFGDNPLGVVPSLNTKGEGVQIKGVLEGSPAQRAGLKEDDRILTVNARLVRSWVELLSLPAMLTIERAGERLGVYVDVSAEQLPRTR